MTTPTHPPVYCPICGATLDIFAQHFPHRAEPLYCYTCENPACPVYGRTCSDSDVADASTLARWHTTQTFDIFTGQRVAA